MKDLPEIDEWDPERPAVYELSSGLVVYRASALGQCLGNLVRVRRGETPDMPPDWLQAAFDWGTDAEPETLRWIQTKGFKLLDEWELQSQFAGHETHGGQLQTEIPVGTDAVIRCHPDGIADRFIAPTGEGLIPNGTRVCVEAKRLSNSWAYDVIDQPDNLPIHYKVQVSVEMYSTGLPCIFVVAVSDKDTHEIEKYEWFPIMEPPLSLGELKLRVMRVEAAYERDEIPECDYAQWPCGFWRDHDETQGVWVKSKRGKAKQREKKGESVRAKDIGIDEGELNLLIESHMNISEVIKVEGPRRKKDLEAKIQAILDAHDLKGKRVHTDRYDLNDVVVEEQKGRVDWKAYATELGAKDSEAEKYRGESTSLRYPKITKLEGEG